MNNKSPQNLQEALDAIRVLFLTVRELQENNRDLQKTVQTLRKDNQTLREENEKLKARLNKNSKNSSKPPSSDIKGNAGIPEQ